MKFAFLFAAVSAISIRGPDSTNDPEHTYSIHANTAHAKVTAANGKNVADMNDSLAGQAAADAWRDGFTPSPAALAQMQR
jgi:hypothetical protein